MESKPDDFSQGRILALRTAFGALVLSHPDPRSAAQQIAEALSRAEAKWLGERVSDLFIEGLQEESADVQALINTSQSLRAPNGRTSVQLVTPRLKEERKETPPGTEP